MNESTDDANREFWNEPAGTHLAKSIGVMDDSAAELARMDAAYFDFYPYLRPYLDRFSGKVLEIGLGYGTVASYLAKRTQYIGLDIADEPVRLARARGVEAMQGSALALPFPDATFDGVVTIGTLHHTGDLPKGIAEVHRVLKPGGLALVMIYNAWSYRRLRHWTDRPEKARARYDADTSGDVAPHTDFTSPLAARRLFSAFREVHIDLRNFDQYRGIKRRRLLGNVDRVLGLDLYITGLRPPTGSPR